MRRILLAALALTAPASGATDAYAAAESAYAGECGFTAYAESTGSSMTGWIDLAAVVYSAAAADNPVSATITCYITVNGEPQPSARMSASGTVVVAGAELVRFPLGSLGDAVAMCTHVDFTSDDTPDALDCVLPEDIEIPPPVVWGTVDPLVCGALANLAGTYGPVVVHERGDVDVAGERFYYCPPAP